jgi:hypothetical protein
LKRYLSYCLIFIVLSAFGLHAHAQDARVEAHVDKVSVPMGDQTVLHLVAHVPAKTSIEFPELKDSIAGKIKIISVKGDTLSGSDTDVITKNYTISAFDAGTYTIPEFTFLTKTRQFTTDSMVVQFKPVAVDTTKSFYDIKQPLTVNYTFWDWLRDHWKWVVGGLLFVGLVIYITWYISKRYEKKPIFQQVKVVLTIDQIALQKLSELRAKRLWEEGQVKEFYIELTDILREYLEKRYVIQAFEQTSEEIFASLKPKALPAAASAKLRDILVLADLVKFAKEKPVGPENEASMEKAVGFVEETKEIVKPEVKETKEELPG